jgi:HAD superfamily hydrolase (TIGR01490 family)
VQLALFDLDHTLLPLDSDYEWTKFLARIGVVDGEEHDRQNDRFYREYQAGTLDIYEFLDFQLAPLARFTIDQLERWHLQFMREIIVPAIRPAARELVDKHASQGDLCALVTATNEFVTAPIARAFGIPNLIATGIERSGNRFTGKPSGIPCFKEGKITNTEQWLAGLGLSFGAFEHSWCYSDSANDIPLLLSVTDPIATNPDARLAAQALLRHWPVIRLFE